jgi:hypothetical protein
MIEKLRDWIKKRQQLRALWRADAELLLRRDERNAYYDAQRLAARCRANKNSDGFSHWAKVAAEVARRSAVTEMDICVVAAIVDEELSRSAH